MNSPTPISTPPPATVAGPPLPAFSDWRVAYIGVDQHLHAVSLDGKTDVAGVTTPISGPWYTGVWSAGTSPDGKHLAYFAGNGWLTVLDAASGVRTSFAMYGDNAVLVSWEESPTLWSPDQRYLVFSGGYVVCVSVADGSMIAFPGAGLGRPNGWLDATHVAVHTGSADTGPSGTAITESLQSLDVITGDLRQIVTIPTTSSGWFAVAPDGRISLFSNSQFRSDPFTPVVNLINNETGAVTPLPRLTQFLSVGRSFDYVLWRPDSHQAIAGTLFPVDGVARYYLVDVDQDSATPLTLAGFPEAWSPDGRTLVVANGDPPQDNQVGLSDAGDVGAVGMVPLTLTALRLDSQGRVLTSATLTTQATTIPVLGFVRTA